MTRDQLTAQISVNLEDFGLRFFTAANIQDSIQDAYDDITSYVMQIEKTIEVNYISNLAYYDLSSIDYMCVVRIFNNNTNKWLQPIRSRDLDDIRCDWETWVGEPTYFFPHSYKLLAIAPHKSVASGSFLVYYRATPNTLESLSVPLINRDSTNLIELYSTADLLLQAKEWEKSEVWYAQYTSALESYRNATKELASSDYNTCLKG